MHSRLCLKTYNIGAWKVHGSCEQTRLQIVISWYQTLWLIRHTSAPFVFNTPKQSPGRSTNWGLIFGVSLYRGIGMTLVSHWNMLCNMFFRFAFFLTLQRCTWVQDWQCESGPCWTCWLPVKLPILSCGMKHVQWQQSPMYVSIYGCVCPSWRPLMGEFPARFGFITGR